MKNATIIFRDGDEEYYEAISITTNGIYTGDMKKKSTKDKNSNFYNYRFIPFGNVEKIIYKNENGKEKTRVIQE